MIESVVAPPSGVRLSWAQIQALYPDQWVVLVEMEWVDDTYSELCSALVAAHGPRRRDPLDQTDALRPRYPCMGHFYTGRPRGPRVLSAA